jgi:hypothetical protein
MQENVEVIFGVALGGKAVYAVNNGVKLQAEV